MTDAEGGNASSNVSCQVDRLFDDGIPGTLCGYVSSRRDLLKCQLHKFLAVVIFVSMMSWGSLHMLSSGQNQAKELLSALEPSAQLRTGLVQYTNACLVCIENSQLDRGDNLIRHRAGR